VTFTTVVGIGVSCSMTPMLMWALGDGLSLGVVSCLFAEIAVFALLFWRRIWRGDWTAAAERSRLAVQ
jgi:hypothetical protein